MHKIREFLIKAVLLAVVLTVTGPALAGEGRYAILLETSGSVEVRQGQGEWKAGEAGMTLHQEDEIRTGRGSTAKLLLDAAGKTGNFELKPESRIRLGILEQNQLTGDKTTVLDLAIGDVLVHAQKLKGASKFQVRTPNSTTGVRGTTFLVSAKAKESQD